MSTCAAVAPCRRPGGNRTRPVRRRWRRTPPPPRYRRTPRISYHSSRPLRATTPNADAMNSLSATGSITLPSDELPKRRPADRRAGRSRPRPRAASRTRSRRTETRSPAGCAPRSGHRRCSSARDLAGLQARTRFGRHGLQDTRLMPAAAGFGATTLPGADPDRPRGRRVHLPSRRADRQSVEPACGRRQRRRSSSAAGAVASPLGTPSCARDPGAPPSPSSAATAISCCTPPPRGPVLVAVVARARPTPAAGGGHRPRAHQRLGTTSNVTNERAAQAGGVDCAIRTRRQ